MNAPHIKDDTWTTKLHFRTVNSYLKSAALFDWQKFCVVDNDNSDTFIIKVGNSKISDITATLYFKGGEVKVNWNMNFRRLINGVNYYTVNKGNSTNKNKEVTLFIFAILRHIEDIVYNKKERELTKTEQLLYKRVNEVLRSDRNKRIEANATWNNEHSTLED